MFSLSHIRVHKQKQNTRTLDYGYEEKITKMVLASYGEIFVSKNVLYLLSRLPLSEDTDVPSKSTTGSGNQAIFTLQSDSLVTTFNTIKLALFLFYMKN
jgi:hypothetical protein